MLSSQHPWDQQIGPFHDALAAAGLLDVPVDRLPDLVARRALLAVTTSDGQVLYPAFQWHEGRLLPGLSEVLAAFGSNPPDGWTVASWLTTPAAALDEATPADWLRRERPAGRVMDLAQTTAQHWAAP